MTNYYRTENAEIKAEAPAMKTFSMSVDDLVQYIQKNFRIDSEGTPANKTTAYLKAVSDAIFDPQEWKAPCYAVCPQCGNNWAEAAIIWYHGRKGVRSFVGVYSLGYAC